MDGKGLVLSVPGSRRFESTNVRAMAKLRLSIAADDLVIIGQCEPLLLLLGGALTFKSDLEN